MAEMTVDQARSDIETIIRIWERQNPLVAKELDEELTFTRSIQDNKFASSRGHGVRFGLLIDAGLQARIEKYYPSVFKDKEQFHWFLQTFPRFAVAEKL